jgi:copper homeostasis protein
MIKVEVAVETLKSALAAEAGGADRLELCLDLANGGLTPDDILVRNVLQQTRIPVFMMVRPRPGDFVYDADEVDDMVRTIEQLRAAGAHGFVTGALTSGQEIDMHAMRAFIDAAGGLPLTFHRAFDRLADREGAIDQLIQLGVQRVLTSGGAASALEGAEALRALVARAQNRLTILAGGGVREDNVAEVIRRSGVSEVHTKLKERADEEVDVARMKQFISNAR